MEVNTMTNVILTNNELKDLLNACSSVKKEIVVAGKKRYIWKYRAILNSDGNPISLENFMVQSGERVYSSPISIKRNTREEIKVAKANYAEEMQRKFGSNWKSEKRGAIVKLYSFGQLSILLK